MREPFVWKLAVRPASRIDRLRGTQHANSLIVDRGDPIEIDHEVVRLDADDDVDERLAQLFGGVEVDVAAEVHGSGAWNGVRDVDLNVTHGISQQQGVLQPHQRNADVILRPSDVRIPTCQMVDPADMSLCSDNSSARIAGLQTAIDRAYRQLTCQVVEEAVATHMDMHSTRRVMGSRRL